MTAPAVIRDGAEMVRHMRPERVPGVVVFRSVDRLDADLIARARGLFREAEGVSVLVPAEPGSDGAMAQITLQVYSALDGVGLTAAVATALAAVGIPANVVAATHHDHVFVPEAQAEQALAVLKALSHDAQTDG